jgi:hypothetical protein
MDAKRFMDAIVSDDGWYCIFAAKDGKLRQKLYETSHLAIQAAMDLDSNGYDTYFALATFETDQSRTVPNIKYLSSFFLDLDCGTETLKEGEKPKKYKDRATATSSLQNFCKGNKLPAPTLVCSGRGLHVYWTFTESVSYEEWKPVAERLKHLTIKQDMLTDLAVTADGARVLRLPQTHNYKDDPPAPVFMLGDGIQPPVDFDEFTKLLGDDPIPVARIYQPAVAGSDPARDRLAGNTEGDFKLLMSKTIAGKGCNQLGIIAKEQATIEEPLWRAGLSIVAQCTDKEKWAKKISKDHPDYNLEDTYKKLDNLYGKPYHCTTFNDLNPKVCPDCPHWGKITAPIQLGNRVLEATPEDNVVAKKPKEPKETKAVKVHEGVVMLPEEEKSTGTVTIPEYPRPYFRPKMGGIYVKDTDQQGDVVEKCVYENDLYIVERVRDPEQGECVVYCLHLPHDEMVTFTVPIAAVMSKQELIKALAMKGVVTHQIGALQDYSMKWINHLQHKAAAKDACRQFGWAENDQAFVAGNKRYSATGVSSNYPSSVTQEYFSMFGQKGTLDGWKNMINFYNRDGMEMHQYVVGSGFGSPLMQYMSGLSSASFHIWNKNTGYGKSTSMFAASTLWGKYQDLVIKAGDTKNAQLNRAEAFKNIAYLVDEITNLEGKPLSDHIYDASSADGKQRDRMGGVSNRARVRGEPWAFLSISTGNTSVINKVSAYKDAPLAEAQRVMEYRAKKFHFDDTFETQEFNRQMEEHYGHAGPIYIRHVMANLPAVKERLIEVQAWVDKTYGLDASNRYWSAHITCVLTGTMIAIEIGLLPYDIRKLKNWVGTLVLENKSRGEVRVKTAKEQLGDFINDNYSNMLVMRGGKTMSTYDANFVPSSAPRGKLVIRQDQDTNTMSISTNALNKWFGERQLDTTSFLEDMVSECKGEIKRVRMYANTGMANASVTNCLVIYYNSDEDEDDG